MKRLKKILHNMKNDTMTYTDMYSGAMKVIDLSCPGMPPSYVCDPTYYSGNVGFHIAGSHKLAQDKPVITVIVPTDELFYKKKEGMPLKRLKYYLLRMENNTSTYNEMYEGKTVVYPTNYPEQLEEIQYDPCYWNGDISFSVENTNKLSKDVPTLTWNIPADKLGLKAYTASAADFCLRALAPYIDALNAELYNRSRPDNENGKYYLYHPGGEVLTRNTAYFAVCPQKDYVNGTGNTVYLQDDGVVHQRKTCLCIKMQVQLPKRHIKKTMRMLCNDLPGAVGEFVREFDSEAFNRSLALAEKQAAIREWLKDSDYCAFIANGSILPRSKGTDLPMRNAIPFQSTPNDEIEVCGVRGMGIKRGVTVITGGGYSGKSTVLDAISAGIYDHASGDGRELCITDKSAVTISAEDGRSIKHVNISPFIKWLPGGDTHDFSTDRASGSTSQAANIMEAVDCGARLLLIDEDRSATNFMIRDNMMKALIEKEPITPFTDRVNELYGSNGVSTILVIGGSGEYLSVADRIYLMEDFLIHDVTEKSKRLCSENGIFKSPPSEAEWGQHRILYSEGFTSYPERCGSERLMVSDMGIIYIGGESIDVRGLHDIITPGQLYSIGFMLRFLEISNNTHIIDIKSRVDALYDKISSEGLDSIYSGYFTTCERFLDLPRKCELISVINRMRKINYS